MRYGLRDGLTTFVGAADSLIEFEEMIKSFDDDNTVRWENPSVMDMMSEERYRGYKRAPVLIYHNSAEEQDAFWQTYNIQLSKPNRLRDLHAEMLDKMLEDPYSAEAKDARTIEEIYGLDKEDPWDKRSDEQKAKDEERAEKIKEAKANGDVTGESFSPKRSKKDPNSDIWVNRVRAHHDKDGNVVIDDVLAAQGSWGFQKDKDGVTGSAATPGSAPTPPAPPSTPNATGSGRSLDDILRDAQSQPAPSEVDAETGLTVEQPYDPSEPFFQFDLIGDDGAFLEQALDDLGVLPDQNTRDFYNMFVVAEGEHAGGGWFRLRSEKLANRMHATLNAHGVKHSIRVVDFTGVGHDAFEPNEALMNEIDLHGPIAIFYRLDITGAYLNDVAASLNDTKLTPYVAARADTPEGCWLAAISRGHGETIVKALGGEYTFEDQYEVNPAGERLVMKGIETLAMEEKVVERPRPWNQLAYEIDRMTDEQKAENLKTVRTNEFVFCGRYTGPQEGTLVWITPRSYFMDKNEMWGESLKEYIGHLLPPDLEEVRPGMYRSFSRNWEDMGFVMSQGGYIESAYFQIYLNQFEY